LFNITIIMNQLQFQRDILIPSTIEGLDHCVDIVNELKNQFDLDFDSSFSLQTVIVESVENAIIHGNKSIKELDVRVHIEIRSHEIFVEVEDQGEGFDLNCIPSPVERSVIQREGGRGIFFIKRLSISCYTVGRGNILRIKLKR